MAGTAETRNRAQNQLSSYGVLGTASRPNSQFLSAESSPKMFTRKLAVKIFFQNLLGPDNLIGFI